MKENRQNEEQPISAGESEVVMKDLPLSEQPYEKCLQYGPECLSEAELLSVIIRTGTHGERASDLARRLLRHLPGKNLGGLFQISIEQLMEVKGIGRVKAVQLKSAAELARRTIQSSMPRNELVCSEPEQVAAYYMNQMRFQETEQVRLLILNGKNRLQREIIISEGSFTSSTASPREIYYAAVKYKAVKILLLHNHPSGDPTPSREDLMLTKRLSECGLMMGIFLLDHIIIGDNQFVSLKKSGYLDTWSE